MPEFEVKSFECEFKADVDAMTVTGYGAIFGNVDHKGDIIEKGAFKDTLKERMPMNGVKYFDRHMTPIGTFKSIKEDTKGLKFVAKVAPTTVGKDHIINVQHKVIDQASIGFRTKKYEIDEELLHNGWPVRRLKAVDLFEISGLPHGANEKTSVRKKALLDMLEREFPGFVDALEGKKVGSFQDLPLAPIDTPAETAASVHMRIFSSAKSKQGCEYTKAFVFHDSQKGVNADAFELPIADIVDGELKVVPRAVFKAAAILQGAHGGIDISDANKARARSHLGRYYAKMRKEFDDENIVAPWEAKSGLVVPVESLEQLQQILGVDKNQVEDVKSLLECNKGFNEILGAINA